MKRLLVGFCVVVVCAIIFSLFWVNRYHYEKSGSDLLRINNWSGQTCHLNTDWKSYQGDVFDQVAAKQKYPTSIDPMEQYLTKIENNESFPWIMCHK